MHNLFSSPCGKEKKNLKRTSNTTIEDFFAYFSQNYAFKLLVSLDPVFLVRISDARNDEEYHYSQLAGMLIPRSISLPFPVPMYSHGWREALDSS